jgi:hypothetical protein
MQGSPGVLNVVGLLTIWRPGGMPHLLLDRSSCTKFYLFAQNPQLHSYFDPRTRPHPFHLSCALPLDIHNMKISDIVPLSDGVYEMEKGVSDEKLCDGDLAKLLFGGIAAGFTPQNFLENDDVL